MMNNLDQKLLSMLVGDSGMSNLASPGLNMANMNNMGAMGYNYLLALQFQDMVRKIQAVQMLQNGGGLLQQNLLSNLIQAGVNKNENLEEKFLENKIKREDDVNNREKLAEKPPQQPVSQQVPVKIQEELPRENINVKISFLKLNIYKNN